MTSLSGCHLKKKLKTESHPVVNFFFKWQPDGLLIWLLIFFQMTIRWGAIQFSFSNQNDNRMKPIRFS